jgi:hypothetical protein
MFSTHNKKVYGLLFTCILSFLWRIASQVALISQSLTRPSCRVLSSIVNAFPVVCMKRIAIISLNSYAYTFLINVLITFEWEMLHGLNFTIIRQKLPWLLEQQIVVFDECA